MKIPVRIIRTKNRSSRAVLANGIVTIRLARGLNAELERMHIEVLTRRMTKAHAKEVSKQVICPFKDLIEGIVTKKEIHPCVGKAIVFELREGTKVKAMKSSRGWTLTRPLDMDAKECERFLWKLLGTSLEVEIARTVRRINEETLNVKIQSISLKKMRSRWGSCSHAGVIALSTPLVMTTAEILRYVVIHELAHVVHMNHSTSFWKVVAKYCPEYKKRMQEIRTYRMSHI